MSCRVIDVHNHPNWYGKDVDALVANMDEHGIEKTWLLSWELPRAEYEVVPVFEEVMDPRGLAAPLSESLVLGEDVMRDVPGCGLAFFSELLHRVADLAEAPLQSGALAGDTLFGFLDLGGDGVALLLLLVALLHLEQNDVFEPGVVGFF